MNRLLKQNIPGMGMILTCEHALDGLLGQALGVLELLNGDGPDTGHIAVDDWRAHIAGAVALHPAILCEGESLQLHAEVLNPAFTQNIYQGRAPQMAALHWTHKAFSPAIYAASAKALICFDSTTGARADWAEHDLCEHDIMSEPRHPMHAVLL